MSQYFFTQNWFESNKTIWNEKLSEFENKPVSFLEIGSHEGVSTTFILDKYINDQQSVLNCIDPFLCDDNTSPVNDKTYEIFKDNVSKSKNYDKLTIYKDKSQNVLPKLLLEQKLYDVIYIDGSHVPKDILFDAIISSNLLAENGYIIFDDYGSCSNDYKIQKTIDSFINALEPNTWCVTEKSYQLFLRKIYNPIRTNIWN